MFENGLNSSTLLLLVLLLTFTSSFMVYAGVWNLNGDITSHDPTLTREDDLWWIFHTGKGLPVKYSSDGINWTQGVSIFSVPLGWWSDYAPNYDPDNDVWAPDISYYNGRWWLYYSVSEFGTKNSVIGLVSATSIIGGDWREDGIVISSGSSTSYNAIDPNLVIDSNGVPWLVFGSWFEGIYLARVDNNTMKPVGSIYSLARRDVDGNSVGIEGATIVYNDGYYYLFVSIDHCCIGVTSDYKIVYGRSSTITGPYIDKNGIDMMNGGGTVLSASDSRYKGHGGQDIYNNNILVHHGYDSQANGNPTLIIQDLYWNNGWPTLGDSDFKGYYKLRNRNSGKYLEVAYANTADGTNVQQWSDTGHATQEWMVYPVGDGYYRLENRNSCKYLEVGNADTVDGSNVQQWGNTGHECQEWSIVNVEGNYYKLLNRNSGKVLDVYNFSIEDGGDVVQWSDLGGTNQQWELIWVDY